MKKNFKKGFSIIELGVVILVIIIILSLIRLTENYFAQNKIDNANKYTQDSVVKSTSDLILWFETSDKSSFSEIEQEDLSAISNWLSSSQFAQQPISFEQKIANNRPNFIKSAINNLPVIEFNGVNSFLELDLTNQLNFRNISIFLVSSSKNFVNDQSTIISFKTKDNKFSLNNIKKENFYNLQFTIDNNSKTVEQFNLSKDLSIKTPVIIEASVSETIINFKINNQFVNQFNHNFTSDNINKIILGAYQTYQSNQNINNVDYANFLHGQIAELIIFNRQLTDQEGQEINQYLQKKWAIKYHQQEL
jgi:type II secretory pathway pseudopilin PulG